MALLGLKERLKEMNRSTPKNVVKRSKKQIALLEKELGLD